MKKKRKKDQSVCADYNRFGKKERYTTKHTFGLKNFMIGKNGKKYFPLVNKRDQNLKIYQLALKIPGINPLFAISRKQRRESLNFLRVPLDLPVIWQRLRKRTGEEFLGSLLRVTTAAERSSSLLERSKIVFFSIWRLSHLS